MNIEKVTPVEKDGIEFYISSDGTKTGMSMTGLAILCGVARRSLIDSPLVTLLEGGGKEPPEWLKGLQGIYSDLEGTSGAKIIPSETCAAMIEYYAYESKAANDTAKAAFRQFAKMGIHSWIKQITGSIERKDEGAILALLQEVLFEVKELRTVSTEYKAIRAKTTTFLPGANDLLDELSKPNLLEASEDGNMSLEAWLYTKGVRLDKSAKYRLAALVADAYRALMQKEPTRASFTFYDEVLLKNVLKHNVSVYEPIAFPVLQICLTKLLS